MSEPIHIDRSRALSLLRDVVADYGRDHRYESPWATSDCVYSAHGVPSCLVGHVLHRAGVAVDELDFMVGPLGGADGDGLPDRVHLDDDAVLVLRTAQLQQDIDRTWGAALDQAEVVSS